MTLFDVIQRHLTSFGANKRSETFHQGMKKPSRIRGCELGLWVSDQVS